jgi:UDP-N-acetyl-D-mannosaminuronic acid transferase (WecB/TagA/CpsF family)
MLALQIPSPLKRDRINSSEFIVPSFPTKRMLGIDFFIGTPAEAVVHISKTGGLVVAPAAPSFVALQDDPDYRRAIADADLAIADSGWAVLFWRLLKREKLTRISGLALFKALLETSDARAPKNLFFVLPSEESKTKTLEFGQRSNYSITADDCYVAPRYQRSEVRGQRSTPSEGIEDSKLVSIIESRRPRHIIIGIGGGMQDKLGSYLKHALSYGPAIYCIGAAPGFVTGDQVAIPMWADRFFVGWIFRLLTQPRILLPRFWTVRRLPAMILRYGRDLPPLSEVRSQRTEVRKEKR